MRMLINDLRVLRVFLMAPQKEFCGWDIAKGLGRQSENYRSLHRLERGGYLAARWENVSAGLVGRPRRKLYKLTELGRKEGVTALKGFQLHV